MPTGAFFVFMRTAFGGRLFSIAKENSMFDRLKEDIRCVKDRDPAARGSFEIMLLYPGFRAVRMYRRAHWFFEHRMFFFGAVYLTALRQKNQY